MNVKETALNSMNFIQSTAQTASLQVQKGCFTAASKMKEVIESIDWEKVKCYAEVSEEMFGDISQLLITYGEDEEFQKKLFDIFDVSKNQTLSRSEKVKYIGFDLSYIGEKSASAFKDTINIIQKYGKQLSAIGSPFEYSTLPA